MADAEDDLRATAEAIQDDAERLRDLEAEKSRLAPDDPRVVALSAQIERLAHALAAKTTAERALANEISED